MISKQISNANEKPMTNCYYYLLTTPVVFSLPIQQTTAAESSTIEAKIDCPHLMLEETFPNDDYDNNKKKIN